MKNFTKFLLMVVFLFATSMLFSQEVPEKNYDMDPYVQSDWPAPRQGGDTYASAVDIGTVPYSNTGVTTGYTDDYTPSCGFSSGSPDVVYSFTPVGNWDVTISLCGSGYDTRLFVVDDSYIEIGCNDDYCGLQSQLDNLILDDGVTYYIVVDGWSSSHGAYTIDITGTMLPPSIDGYALTGGGQTIAGAEVRITENGRTATTDPTGYYTFYGIPDGTYNLTASKTGYNPAGPVEITITGGNLVSQDFTLTAPNLTVSPLIFDETLHPNEYLTTYLGLLNTGDGLVNWAAGIVFPMPPPAQSAVSIIGMGIEKDESQRDSEAVAERPGYKPGGQGIPAPGNSGLRGSIAFGYEAWFVNDPFDFDVDDIASGNFVPAVPSFPNWVSGMVFPRGETDFVYVTVADDNHLYELERATGIVTDLGALSGSLPLGFLDLTVDPTSGIIYGVGDDELYIIDPLGMTSTYIGYMGANVFSVTGIACDAAGDMWAYDFGYDWFYSVDKNTGNATDVGSLGVSTSFGATMFYDEATDNILITTYNNSNLNAEVRVVDRMTGGTSVLSYWYDSWFTAADIPGGSVGPEDGWLTLDSYSGEVLPGGGSYNIGVNFDAGGTTAGEIYTADIVISTNPFVGEVTIPVTMTIAGDPFPTINDFTATLTDAATGEVTLSWTGVRQTLDYYMIYRDGAPLTTVTTNTYVDMLPGFGAYEYELQPVFLEGDGVLVGPEEVEWFEPELCFPDGNTVENDQWVDQVQEVTLALQNCASDGVLSFEFDGPATFVVGIEPAAGYIAAGQTVDVTLTYSSMGYTEGDYDQELIITTNEPDAPVSREQTHSVYNWMYVYEPEMISGTVTDCNTGEPLENVVVTAYVDDKDFENMFSTFTSDDGTYMLYVNPGDDYNMMAERVGYQTESAYVDEFDLPAVVDFALCEEPYPVGHVFADPNEADTECMVTWSLPWGPYMIEYDDGTAEDYFSWVSAGGMSAVKFTPAGYPATVQGAHMYLGMGVGDVEFVVLDDDGPGGMPGTIMDSATVVAAMGWVDATGLDATFEDGDFYIAYRQVLDAPEAALLGVDEDSPTVYRSYVKDAGGDWMVSSYNDFMIRAIVSGPGDNVVASTSDQMIYPGKLSLDLVASGTPRLTAGVQGKGNFTPVIVENPDRDLATYQLYRISDIDPDGGVPVELGTHTLLEPALTSQMYNDTDWEDLDPGFYAYGVTATYDNDEVSDMTYSNIVAHLLDNVVTLNITQCDELSPEGAEVTLTGQNFPGQILTATTDATGVVVFDSVIDGTYDLLVTKTGYIDYVHNNIWIYDDYTEDIVLEELTYPAHDLVVDPLTSIATWKSPYVEFLANEGFEGEDFPPAGWQVLALPDGAAFEQTDAEPWWMFEEGDGNFALVDDDAAPIDAASISYLVMPTVDLSETDGFLLQFDAYYLAIGETAYVIYSLDGGASWVAGFSLPGTGAWTTHQVNLDFLAGNSSVTIAFYYDDNDGWQYGLGIDNVMAYWGKEPVGYYVYLDGGFVAETAADVTMYQYQDLVYGQTYEASVRALYSCDVSDPIFYTFTSSYLYPPRNLMDEYVYGTNEIPLYWNPPWDGVEAILSNVENGEVVGTTAHSIGAAPATAGSVTEVTGNVGFNGLRDGHTAYFMNATSDVMYSMDMSDYSYTEVGASVIDGATGDFMNNEEDVWYVAGDWGANLYSVDVATGAATLIAPITGENGLGLSGMACDRTTNTMYVSFTDITQSGFGTIDVTTGVVTQIGIQTDAPGIIEIAIDGTGTMYAWDLVTDNSYTVDKTTGAVTLLGSLGVDLNYGQGGNWDSEDDVIYMTAYNNAAGTEFRALDRVTGGTTLLGPLPTSQNGAFGVPGGGSVPLPPDGLLSFNLYESGAFVANVPYEGQNVEEWVMYVDNNLLPGCYTYDVTALYDLTEFGFAGEIGESMKEGPHEVCIVWGIDLPFCEDFTQGYDFNGWMADDNWTINAQVGNDAPSAQWNWDPDPGTPYMSTLESPPFNADMLTEGNIWLDFDIALDERNSTGAEMIKVEVYNGATWDSIAAFVNDGSFAFTSQHIDITSYAMDGAFQVRFNATGVNSFDVIAWNIDNVCLYRTCDAPFDLTGEYAWNAADDFGAEVCWEAEPPTGGGGTEELVYDNGVATGGYSYEGFVMATQMSPAGPCQVLELKYFVSSGLAPFNAVVFDWAGTQPGTTELFNEGQMPTVEGDWMVVDITSDNLMVDGDFMVGFGSINGDVYMGYDTDLNNGRSWDYDNAGTWAAWSEAYLLRAVVLYPDGRTEEIGATIKDGTVTISPNYVATEHSRDYTAVETVDPMDARSARELAHFNVYRSMEGADDYMMVGTVAAEAGVSEYCYFDTDVDIQTGYCYKVTAVYMSEEDECESDFAMDVAEEFDYVCVFVTDVENPTEITSNLYPNPARDQVTITSNVEMSRVTVINYVGQIVEDMKVSQQKVTLNTSAFESGVYVVRIETEKEVITKRFAIAR